MIRLSLALGALILLQGCFWPGLPDVRILKTHYPVAHPQKPPRQTFYTFEKRKPESWADLDQVSKAATGAIVVSEDWAFYHHKGYDPNQIKEAINKDLVEGKYSRGASTITQQVAKNLFLDSGKSIVRKLKELQLAMRLEDCFKKRKILEVYLNIAEWGEDIYGIGPASWLYFNKSPRELSAKEGAFLAMLLPSPKRYSQSFRAKRLTPYAAKTVSDILSKMVQAGYISEEERVAQASKPLSFEKPGGDLKNIEAEPDELVEPTDDGVAE